MRIWMVAAAAATAVVSVVAASYVSLSAVAAVTAVLILVGAIGWPHLLGVPAKKTQSTVMAASALAATAAAYTAPDSEYMRWMPIAAALGLGAVFLIQLFRGTGQSLRLESTLGVGVGVFLVCLGSGWVAADQLSVNAGNAGMMLVTGISVMIALAVSLLPWPDRIVAPLGTVLAATAGPLGAILFTDVPGLAAGIVGALSGAVIVCTRRLLLAREAPLNVAAALSVGVAPILVIGSLVYFLEKLLTA
ncbi:hypothetical protein [Arthrobacter sp. Bz4]|uniref:hypothetical protein n=1 Tax=Arthrobacter sp. Bz4 TaxID=2171979 RepID=UPI001FAF7B91|nr:hypothetical protein [Arthrobacter sp. Bz4]